MVYARSAATPIDISSMRMYTGMADGGCHMIAVRMTDQANGIPSPDVARQPSQQANASTAVNAVYAQVMYDKIAIVIVSTVNMYIATELILI
jgi:hypothetical protein